MATKLVRIVCRPHDVAEYYNYAIMLEAALDGDVLRLMPWLGTADFQGIYPFRLDTNGRMDFGVGYEDKDRYWNTTIFGKPIRPGEVFSIIGTDENAKERESLYAIHTVDPL